MQTQRIDCKADPLLIGKKGKFTQRGYGVGNGDSHGQHIKMVSTPVRVGNMIAHNRLLFPALRKQKKSHTTIHCRSRGLNTRLSQIMLFSIEIEFLLNLGPSRPIKI